MALEPTGLRQQRTIAILGTGRVGGRIARRLLASGFSVHAWNRTISKAQELESEGAKVFPTANGAVRGATAVLISQRDGNIVRDLLFTQDVAAALTPGTIVVDLSSVQPEISRENHRRLSRRDIPYLDATLTGGLVGAEAGTMLVMVGGSADALKQVSDIMRVMGRTIHVGESGAGAFAKVAHQMIMGATAAAMAEVVSLAKATNIDTDLVLETFRGGLVHSRALELYTRRMQAHDFEGRGAGATLQVKDMRNAIGEASRAGIDLPVTRQILSIYEDLIEQHGDLDKSAILLMLGRK